MHITIFDILALLGTGFEVLSAVYSISAKWARKQIRLEHFRRGDKHAVLHAANAALLYVSVLHVGLMIDWAPGNGADTIGTLRENLFQIYHASSAFIMGMVSLQISRWGCAINEEGGANATFWN